MIDAHVHLWSSDTSAFPFGPHDGVDLPKEAFDHSRLVAAMDAAGVTHALAIQPRIYGYDQAYLLHAAACAPDRLRLMPLLNPVRPTNVEQAEALAAHPLVAGFRVIALSETPAEWLVGVDARRLWKGLVRINRPLGLLIRPEQLAKVEELGRLEPELRIVVDHLGGISADGWAKWGTALLRLGDLPNTYVKVSALGHLSRTAFPHVDMHEPVRKLVERFGPDRLMWGTDWPHAYAFGPYEDAARSVVAALGLGGSELDRVLSGTARSLFGFGGD